LLEEVEERRVIDFFDLGNGYRLGAHDVQETTPDDRISEMSNLAPKSFFVLSFEGDSRFKIASASRIKREFLAGAVMHHLEIDLLFERIYPLDPDAKKVASLEDTSGMLADQA